MKKILFFTLAVVALLTVGCKKEETIQQDLLIGHWAAPSHYGPGNINFVFQSTACSDKPEMCWGYQWDEGNDVQESDVTSHSEDHNDPGWFGWKVNEDKTSLWTLSRTGSGGWGETYAKYTISNFSATSMTLNDGGDGIYELKKQN